MDLIIQSISWGGLALLSGSIPYGLILSKLFCHVDVRAIGSGNIGATNVLRTGNKKIAALTLLLDGLKAYLPIFLAILYVPENKIIPYIAGTCSILGHVFSPWLKFKGGKGIASALGAYLAFDPLLGLSIILIWLILGKIFKISSLAALVSFTCGTLWSLIIHGGFLGTWALLIYLLILWTHRDNIKRLINGQESTIKL